MTASSPQGRPQGRGLAVALALALTLATAFVFSGVTELGWVDYDDPALVTNNEHVAQGLTRDSIHWAFTTTIVANWFPITWLSHMLDWELFGDDVGAFHVTSVLLHLANTLLLFAFLVRATGRLGAAAVVAGLFALHPAHVETVVWLSERKGVLSALFFLAALHAYVGHARRPSSWRMAGVAAWFALGLASKPMLVTLPFLLLLLDVWPFERIDREVLLRVGRGGGSRAWLRDSGVGPLVLEKWPLFLLALGSVFLTLAVQDEAVVSVEMLPLSGRFATVGTAYWTYLGMLVWPADLSPIHLHPGRGISLIAGGIGCLGLLIATSGALAALRRCPAISVGWLWFLGMLLPVSGLVQLGNAIVAERYTYLAFIGLFVAVVWPAAEAMGPGRRARGLAAALAVVVLVGCAAVSRARVDVWRDTVSLFRSAVEADPSNYLAHGILGLGYARARDEDAAIASYARAAKLDPGSHTLLYRIGRRLARKGDGERARRAFTLELEVAPGFAPAHNELAILLLAQGRLVEARAELERVLEINPNYTPAQENLAIIDRIEQVAAAPPRQRVERTATP